MSIRVYMDICCFNRPYDEQSSLRIQLETQAKLYVQKLIVDNKVELVWSFVMSYENAMNPFIEKRIRIAEWRKLAIIDCGLSSEIFDKSKELNKLGLHVKDSYHIACAINANADFFITTDKGILNKQIDGVRVISPVEFTLLTEENL